MTEAKLIAMRVILAIVAVCIFPFSAICALSTMALFVIVELIDWADGLVAERDGQGKVFGGFLDISADQCIETLFWFLFIDYHLVPIWMPIVILLRNTFINLLRVHAIALGQDMFGSKGMLHSRAARLLVGTRVSRGTMVLVKTIGFTAAILLHVGIEYGGRWVPIIPFDPQVLHIVITSSLTCLVGIHIGRGIILVSEARGFLGVFLWRTSDESESATIRATQ